MAEYALAVDLGSEVTAAVSDDAGHRIVPIGDAGQLALPGHSGWSRPAAHGRNDRSASRA